MFIYDPPTRPVLHTTETRPAFGGSCVSLLLCGFKIGLEEGVGVAEVERASRERMQLGQSHAGIKTRSAPQRAGRLGSGARHTF